MKMDETLRGVAEFHKAFGSYTASMPEMPAMNASDAEAVGSIAGALEVLADYCLSQAERTKGSPAHTAFLRLQLQVEELSERARAYEASDIVALLDALTDEQYVLDGSYLAHGLQELKLPAHREVQRSNMTKLGDDGKPIINDAGRVVKGPNYEKPRLKELVYRHLYVGDVG